MKNVINTMKVWAENHTKTAIAVAIAIVAVISLSVAGMTGVFGSKPADTASSKSAMTAEVPANTEKTSVTINVEADDKVTEASTPAIVHVQSTDTREEPVDFYHAVDSGKKTDTVEVSPGEYKVTVTGVINNDGSVAKPAKESKEIAVSIKSTDKKGDAENKATVNVKLDKTIPADKVTEKDIKEIADTTKTAIENGDNSLKGDAGKAILGKVEANTKANKNLSDDAKDAVAESTDKAQASTETEAKTTVTDAPQSASKPSAPANSNPAPSKPAEKAKTWVPEKGHWENITQTVTVTDQEAWDEQVYTGTAYVFADGYTTTSDADARAHAKQCILDGKDDGYQFVKQYKTVHHPAKTHTETKVVDRKWVVDVPGHYE